MKGLILAGGKGTRLRPLTINTPKPIVPVANSPFLLYQIDLMRSAGIEEIILSLSYQPRKIEDLLERRLRLRRLDPVRRRRHAAWHRRRFQERRRTSSIRRPSSSTATC